MSIADFIYQTWDDSIIPELEKYIRIPNKSPNFDPDWEKHGYMDDAVELMVDWCKQQTIAGMQVKVEKLQGRTPLIYIDIPAFNTDSTKTVLLYGHLDKQPEFDGWDEDLAPWKPVIKDGKLYGRGGADDGYAIYGSLTAIRALQENGGSHARCVVVIEACEESGSYDLPYYLDHIEKDLGTPSLVVCLDAECGNYDQLWCTTSLRGNMIGTLRVDVLTEGVHSGAASGISASSFRVIRELLDRVENSSTGDILVSDLKCEIPQQRLEQAQKSSALLGPSVFEKLPWHANMQPVSDDVLELVLNNTWRPTLSVTGAEGLPDRVNAGNVLRPFTEVKLSFRLPPLVDGPTAAKAVKKIFESDVPYNASATFTVMSQETGWSAPQTAPWLEDAMQEASLKYFERDSMYMGTGGTIPFMNMLGTKYPGVQFLVTGLLGPRSNAHGPNEFLHIETGKRLTACVAHVLEAHAKI
ncbi:MAG: M20/M25/M40 family metallo-hydrolase [Gammaproteobacteria bacterium]|nr:M20 family metallopeptidase [Gammaproteobacteria bacterium]NNC97020.1 M20/M25/M40 family metallo-hydrolase [Gammaproteobacteria bacterium]NNM13874.1 M20/M25/M40 family metallo-hydrolase [Gammaproteobacteria bacterium]